jgi:hypothetical protein
MRFYTTLRPTRMVTGATCGFCGERIRPAVYVPHNEVFDPGTHIPATILAMVGPGIGATPLGGDDCHGTRSRLDCCLKCWTGKVRPALEALGGKFEDWSADNGPPDRPDGSTQV